MREDLKLRRDGPSSWLLIDTATGIAVGGIDYVHAADGRHYRPWLLVGEARQHIGDPVSQLDIAARAVAAHASSAA